jgi:hypothetical protein
MAKNHGAGEVADNIDRHWFMGKHGSNSRRHRAQAPRFRRDPRIVSIRLPAANAA